MNLAENGAVYWNLVEIASKSVPVSVWIGEDSSLKNAIVRKFDTRNNIAWREGNLLHLSKEVRRVSVENKLPNRDQGVVSVRPDLCDVSHIIPVGSGISFRHRLDVEGPSCALSRSKIVEEFLLAVVSGLLLDLFHLLRR